MSSVGSDKSLKEASIGKLTERQIAGAQIKKQQLQAKLRRITEAFKYVQATGTKVSDETLQRYEQIRKKLAKELRLCLRFLQAEQEEVLEEKSSSPTKLEGDQKVPSHSPIPRETVSPIGKDTIPPRYKVTTPPLNGKSMGPTLSESLRERADALYKTHTITNGYGLQSTPPSLETLSKQCIAKSDKKSLKVPINTTPQLNEFLLHNPGIIEPDKLDWNYEDDQQSHDGSYSPIDHKKTMTTPQTSPLDWRRVKLPPGTKLPTHVYGEIPPYPCKYYNMTHIGMICPCKCGWIHLTKECPEVPYQPPKEEKPEYSVGPCWSCEQGHFARTCPNVDISAKKEIPNFFLHYKEVPRII